MRIKGKVMHIKSLMIASFLLLAPIGIFAEETPEIACSKGSVCVDSNDFIAEVMRVRHRGNIVTVQVRFVSKQEKLVMEFRYSNVSSYGYAQLVDANGQEIKVDGFDISNFKLNKGEKQIVSFTFRGQKKKPITEPFDVTVKSHDYEVTFFDLGSKSQRINNNQKQ